MGLWVAWVAWVVSLFVGGCGVVGLTGVGL